MQEMPKLKFPESSLLVAMLGEHASLDVRRAARRLRAEGAPALAIGDDIADLARGLAFSEVSRSPAVLDALPPLFWLEAQRENRPGARTIGGWVIEKRRGGLVARGFNIALDPEAAPEAEGATTVSFDGSRREEADDSCFIRGLVTAISLPDVLSQMGEGSPVVLIPATASDQDASFLRGFRLSVAISRDSAPS